MEYTRYYRLLTVEKKDLELDLKALGIPGMFRGAVSAVAQKHLQRALDRRQPARTTGLRMRKQDAGTGLVE